MKSVKLILLSAVFAMFSFTYGTFKTAIAWKSTELVLGDIPQNIPVKIEFDFTNTGDAPLLITNVQAGCGCTSVEFAKTPVKPGATSQITAIFNAAAKGAFKKTVTVTSNAEETNRVLIFSGTVIEATPRPSGVLN